MVVKSPEVLKPESLKVFLAGSIEMGNCADWQTALSDKMGEYDIVFFNPRRDDWDSSWGVGRPQLVNQIKWELEHLENSDVIVMYIDPETKSPISLLELGLHMRSGKLIVCCPEGFYRRDNVLVTCEMYNVRVFNTLSELEDELIIQYKAHHKLL